MPFWSDLRVRLFGAWNQDEAAPESATASRCALPDSPPLHDLPTDESINDVIPAPTVTPVSAATVAARQEHAAGLILEDERLRGDLTDDEYQPLQTWALAASDRIVEQTIVPDDDAAMAEIGVHVAQVKEAVSLAAEAVAAHVSGAVGQRASALAALADLVAASGFQAAVPAARAEAVQAVAVRLATDDTGDGVQAAELIVGALTAAGQPPVDSVAAPAERFP